MALTLDEANRIVAGAVAKAQEMNIKISVAVCDAGGRLMAFNRMDGAIFGSIYGSQGKAVGSAGLASPRRGGPARAGAAVLPGIGIDQSGHMIPPQGAVPIV